MAAILAAVFCFLPMALVSDAMASPESVTFIRPTDLPVLFVVDGVVALLLFIAIFLYKNTARQRTVTLVSMLLIVVVMVTEVCYLLSWDAGAGARVEWLGSIFLLLGALVSRYWPIGVSVMTNVCSALPTGCADAQFSGRVSTNCAPSVYLVFTARLPPSISAK